MKGVKEDVAALRQQATLLPKFMVAMFNLEKVVYCRYGKDYIPYIHRQMMIVQQNPAFETPLTQCATYLINIKKLVQDHNIESGDKDFTKLKTKGKVN